MTDIAPRTPLHEALRPVWSILIGASLMLSLSMGLRQSMGLFMPAMTSDLGVSVSQFTWAVAIQNLAWGLFQPFAGALAARYGLRPVMAAGAVLYVVGWALLSRATGYADVLIGAGIMVGVGMACTGSALAMSASTRVVSPAVRSTVLGMVSAAGSLGAMVAAPLGQWLNTEHGWRFGLLGFALLALVMVPAAWVAGRADRVPLPQPVSGTADGGGAWQAVRMASGSLPFVVMSGAYFVCGMQLIFLTTHLPSYLDLCGQDPMLSAQALGMIGGFNVLGSLFFGWAGGRANKLVLLGGIYVVRSAVLAWYFMDAPTPAGTLVFAAIMGFLWLGVVPLVAGSVVEMFGLRWQAMIQGLAFMSHQLGSFTGAFGGGLIYDALGSYELAWRIGVGVGLTVGVIQIAVALWRPPARPPRPPAQELRLGQAPA